MFKFDINTNGGRQSGFSLVETALVLLLVGFLLSLGTASWSTLATSKRIAQTRSELLGVKQCLVRHVSYSGRYPTFASSTDCSQNQETDLGVCLCRNNPKDVWGNPYVYLEGRDINGDGLAGKSVVDNGYLGMEAADIDADTYAADASGQSHTSVAFVLVSLGGNGLADGVFDDFSSGITARTMGKPVDFSVGGEDFDDIYVIVTTRELRATLQE